MTSTWASYSYANRILWSGSATWSSSSLTVNVIVSITYEFLLLINKYSKRLVCLAFLAKQDFQFLPVRCVKEWSDKVTCAFPQGILTLHWPVYESRESVADVTSELILTCTNLTFLIMSLFIKNITFKRKPLIYRYMYIQMQIKSHLTWTVFLIQDWDLIY